MYSVSKRKYKIKYTRELSRILLIRFPPIWNVRGEYQSYGLTGNFLPVIVRVNSSRRFKKLRGWYWVEYAVTNRYAKISERMQIHELDKGMLERLWYRYRTVELPEMPLEKLLGNKTNGKEISYITVIDKPSIKLYLFYINEQRKEILKSINGIKAKALRIRRFGIMVSNYVTDDASILKLLFKRGENNNEENNQGNEEE